MIGYIFAMLYKNFQIGMNQSTFFQALIVLYYFV
jgi:hypothetical protein